MRKRPGRAGEIGLFTDSEIFDEEFASIPTNTDVKVKITSPRSLKQLRYAWALATKISQACDWLQTKDEAMEFMLIEAKHVRRIYDPLRKIAYLRPLPTNFGEMDGTKYSRLLNRMVYVATTLIVPGLPENDLKREVEAMLAPTHQDFR